MTEVLEERHFPVTEFIPVASERSVGKKVMFNGKEYSVVSAEDAIAAKPDLAIFSAGGGPSKELAPKFAAVGCRVVDNSSCWRMDPTKKLVVPEVNADVLTKDDYIIANPNCSTIQMLLPLAPLHRKYRIKRVVVSTYQSVTGAGNKAVAQMEAERGGAVWGEYPAKFPHPIDQNIIPHIDDFLENGYTKEEMKMVNETVKIFNDPTVKVTATCVRVPVVRSHSVSICLKTKEKISVERAREVIAAAPGVKLVDDLGALEYPMPLDTQNQDLVFVGRIREDLTDERGLNLWCCGDQVRKGAATNAVQITELLTAL